MQVGYLPNTDQQRFEYVIESEMRLQPFSSEFYVKIFTGISIFKYWYNVYIMRKEFSYFQFAWFSVSEILNGFKCFRLNINDPISTSLNFKMNAKNMKRRTNETFLFKYAIGIEFSLQSLCLYIHSTKLATIVRCLISSNN